MKKKTKLKRKTIKKKKNDKITKTENKKLQKR